MSNQTKDRIVLVACIVAFFTAFCMWEPTTCTGQDCDYDYRISHRYE